MDRPAAGFDELPAGAAARPLWLVLDACVLMSSILRPLLLEMAEGGWFQPVWSERIGLEWRRNAARIWGVPPEALEAEWQAMCRRFPTADPGEASAYEAGLQYSDPKDRHVIAAGLASRARAGLQVAPEVRVLTWNLKDFNRSELRRQGLSVWDPDRQFAAWAGEDRGRMLAALATVPVHAQALGRIEPASVTLRRERLFRTGRLLSADLDSAN